MSPPSNRTSYMNVKCLCPRQRDKLQENNINSNHDRMIYGNVLHSECNSLYLQTFNKYCATDEMKMFLNLTCKIWVHIMTVAHRINPLAYTAGCETV